MTDEIVYDLKIRLLLGAFFLAFYFWLVGVLRKGENVVMTADVPKVARRRAPSLVCFTGTSCGSRP